MQKTMWDDIYSNHRDILRKISEYNTKTASDGHAEGSDVLDVGFYYDLIVAHVINLLVDDKSLYAPDALQPILTEYHSKINNYVKWHRNNQGYYIEINDDLGDTVLLEKLVINCFSKKERKFVESICAQDMLTSSKLAKDIDSILTAIHMAIIVEVKGEDELFRIALARRNGETREQKMVVKDRYFREYTRNSTLLYNRVFRHNYQSNGSVESVILPNHDDGLNFKFDHMYCQAAVLHIGVEATGSSGTAFLISKDGYALTCAHVVEGAKEVCANVIVGDGYLTKGFEDFGIYDVGFGEVKYTNRELDIALLKTEYCGSQYLSMEQNQLLPEIGEEVVVFGYPLGYEMPKTNKFGPNISFYKGYVSSNQVQNGNSITFLDIDVKSGNSGSPVISTKTGKVIGIISGIKVGSRRALTEKMPYMIPIQHFLKLI